MWGKKRILSSVLGTMRSSNDALYVNHEHSKAKVPLSSTPLKVTWCQAVDSLLFISVQLVILKKSFLVRTNQASKRQTFVYEGFRFNHLEIR